MRSVVISLATLIALMAVATPAFSGGVTQEAVRPGLENVNRPPMLPIVEEPVTLRLLGPIWANVIDIHTNEAKLYQEELTGLRLDFDVLTPDEASQRVSLLIASGERLPDVIFGHVFSMEQVSVYGEQGFFASINEYMDDGWAPNLQWIAENDPIQYRAITATDGNVYSFTYSWGSSFHSTKGQRMWINQKWLDTLGLPLPTTIDEYYDTLVAFRDSNPMGDGRGNEIPLAGDQGRVAEFLMNPFVANTGTWRAYSTYMIVDESGQIRSVAMEPGFREGLRFLRRLYAENLLDAEAFTMQPAQLRTLAGHPEGNRIGSIQAFALSSFMEIGQPGARDEMVILPPLEGPDGERRTPHYNWYGTPNFLISSESQHIEAAVRLGDLFDTDVKTDNEDALKMILNLQWGPNGWRPAEPGEISLSGEPARWAWTFSWGTPTNINYPNVMPSYTSGAPKRYMVRQTGWDQEIVLYEAAQLYEQYAFDRGVPPVMFPADLASELLEIRTLVNDAIQENIARFVMGTLNIDSDRDWEAYLRELDRFGMGMLLAETQRAYDAQWR